MKIQTNYQEFKKYCQILHPTGHNYFACYHTDGGAPIQKIDFQPSEQVYKELLDMNNDGYLDIVFGNQKKSALAAIYYGDGTRNYSVDKRIQFSNSEGTGNPGVADLNKDGLLDIAFAHSKNIKIYYQKKSGKFKGPIIIPLQAKTMTIGDVNNDGWLDLVCPYREAPLMCP